MAGETLNLTNQVDNGDGTHTVTFEAIDPDAETQIANFVFGDATPVDASVTINGDTVTWTLPDGSTWTITKLDGPQLGTGTYVFLIDTRT